MRLAIGLGVALLVLACRPTGSAPSAESAAPPTRGSRLPASDEGTALLHAISGARSTECGESLATLRADHGLLAMARDAAGLLVRSLSISHRLGSETAERRAAVHGVDYFVGEILASANIDSSGAVRHWLRSPPHRRVLCSPAASHVGWSERPSDRRHGVQIFVAEFAAGSSKSRY